MDTDRGRWTVALESAALHPLNTKCDKEVRAISIYRHCERGKSGSDAKESAPLTAKQWASARRNGSCVHAKCSTVAEKITK